MQLGEDSSDVWLSTAWFPHTPRGGTENCSEFTGEEMGTSNQAGVLQTVTSEPQASTPQGAAGPEARGSWLPASARASAFPVYVSGFCM